MALSNVGAMPICVSPRKQSKRARVPEAAAVLASFNTWAFKREQPSTEPPIERAVARCIASDLPVEFVLYWGKGPRNVVAEPEIACLEFLAAMGNRIAGVYPRGAAFRLICTDTHAALNGHSAANMAAYFASVAAAASVHGFDWRLLSDVVAAHAPATTPVGERSPATLQQLERSAARWYRGGGRAIDGAIAYYDMNMSEKRAMALAYPHAIFVTFNGSEVRELFPDELPIFYMYSLRKGVSIKPWFIGDPANESVAPVAATA